MLYIILYTYVMSLIIMKCYFPNVLTLQVYAKYMQIVTLAGFYSKMLI